MPKILDTSYDYPAKGTVRNHWVPFAASGACAKQLEGLRAWFLPGPQALEVPLYLRVGFKTRQLFGFERVPERVREINRLYPDLRVYSGSLKEYLKSDEVNDQPDWVNLDIDGSALMHEFEIRETIRRLRLDRLPTVGISSICTRDHYSLCESVKLFSVWASILPELFNTGIDILRSGNERTGLVLREPAATHAICRELAVLLLIARAFGERIYGSEDAAAAEKFRAAFQKYENQVSDGSKKYGDMNLVNPHAIPIICVSGLRNIFAARKIPAVITRRLRFAYQTPRSKWRWAWYFKFNKVSGSSMLD